MAFLFIYACLKLFLYLRDRNWKFPTFREIATPKTKDISFVDFICIAESQGWNLGHNRTLNDNQHSIFNKIIREAAIKGWLEISGRRKTLSESGDSLAPNVQISKEFWSKNILNFFPHNLTDNNKVCTHPDVMNFLEIENNNGIEYFDLHLNEKLARKWLTIEASNYK